MNASIHKFRLILSVGVLVASCVPPQGLLEQDLEYLQQLPPKPRAAMVAIEIPPTADSWDLFKPIHFFVGDVLEEGSLIRVTKAEQIIGSEEPEFEAFYLAMWEGFDRGFTELAAPQLNYQTLRHIKTNTQIDPLLFRKQLAEDHNLDLVIEPRILGGPFSYQIDRFRDEVAYGPQIQFLLYARSGEPVGKVYVWNQVVVDADANVLDWSSPPQIYFKVAKLGVSSFLAWWGRQNAEAYALPDRYRLD